MTVVPHITFGFCAAATACYISPMECSVPLLAASMFGATLPDIDCRKSFIGRSCFLVSAGIEAALGHRGALHSPFAWAALFLPAMMILHSSEYFVILTGLCIGYASHLFADWQTSGGIPLLWPVKRRFKAPWAFKTGSVAEVAVFAALLAISAGMLNLPT